MTHKQFYLVINSAGGWGKAEDIFTAFTYALINPAPSKLYIISEDATFDGMTVEGTFVKKIKENAFPLALQKKIEDVYYAMNDIQYTVLDAELMEAEAAFDERMSQIQVN